MQNIGNMSKRQLRREQEKYQAYANGDVKKPYIFDASKPYDLNELFEEGASSLKSGTTQEGYTLITDVNENELIISAENLIRNHPEDMADAWEGYRAKDLYGGSMLEWAKASIKARKEYSSYINYTHMAQMIRAANYSSGGGTQPINYYENNIAPVGAAATDFNVNNATVNKGWLVTLDADITDPNKGGFVNDNNGTYDIFYLDDNGNPVKLKGANFGSVKAVSALDAMENTNLTRGDAYNELLKVKVDITWDSQEEKETFLNANEIDLEDSDAMNKFFDKFNFRQKGTLTQSDLYAGMLGKSGVGIDKNILESEEYIAVVWMPMQRYKKSAAHLYNKWMDSEKNAREAELESNVRNLIEGERLNWDDGTNE